MKVAGASSEEELKCLGDKIAETSARIDVELHRFLTDLRRFDDERGWELSGMLSCAHWLSWRCGIALRVGREKVRVAHALADLPAISDALRTGAVSYSKVRAMTRVATPENEAALLELAKSSTAAELEEGCRTYGQQHPTGREPERYLRVRETPLGMSRMTLQLRPEEMARLLEALAATSQSAVDGMLSMAEGVLRGDSPDRPAVEVLVHVDAATLTGTIGDAGIPADTCKRLLCDGGVRMVLEDADGKTQEVGRKHPTFSMAFRRALGRRDDCCRFPGCTEKRVLAAHQIKHWSEGGEITLANTILLCRLHHAFVHEGGSRIVVQDGKVQFFSPRGVHLGTTWKAVAPASDVPAAFWADEIVDYELGAPWAEA